MTYLADDGFTVLCEAWGFFSGVLLLYAQRHINIQIPNGAFIQENPVQEMEGRTTSFTPHHLIQ